MHIDTLRIFDVSSMRVRCSHSHLFPPPTVCVFRRAAMVVVIFFPGTNSTMPVYASIFFSLEAAKTARNFFLLIRKHHFYRC